MGLFGCFAKKSKAPSFEAQQRTAGESPRPSQKGDAAVFWDIENCPVPSSLSGSQVADALYQHAAQFGRVSVFHAHGNMSGISSRVRTDLQQSGVALLDIPPGRKEAADKALLVDMLLYAVDHKPPAALIIITGDKDFSVAMTKLKYRRYRVVLLHPSSSTGRHVSENLLNSATDTYHYDDVIGTTGERTPVKQRNRKDSNQKGGRNRGRSPYGKGKGGRGRSRGPNRPGPVKDMNYEQFLRTLTDHMLDQRLESMSFPEVSKMLERNSPTHRVKGLKRMVSRAEQQGAVRVTGKYPKQRIHLTSATVYDTEESEWESASGDASRTSDYTSDEDSSYY